MILERTFKLDEHEEYGTLGFKPIDMPHADPLQGMAVVHDVLEHFPNDDGGVEAELMALGAMFRVRGEAFFAARGCADFDPAEHCAADFGELRHHIEAEGFSLIKPGGQEGMAPLDDEHVEEWIERTLRLARNNDYHDDTDAMFWDGDRALRAKRWLRLGYARACDRFEGTSTAELAHLFANAENYVDRVLKTHGEEYIGSEWRLTIDTEKRTFRFEEHFEDFED